MLLCVIKIQSFINLHAAVRFGDVATRFINLKLPGIGGVTTRYKAFKINLQLPDLGDLATGLALQII